jgi:peptidoglycan/xylan/chitin deacetylase (PgdA/CDA1 family)
MNNITKPKWPDGKQFALCLTHDVDRVKKTYQYFTRFMRFSKNLQIKNAGNEIFNFLNFYFSKGSKKDPYWNFEIIMEIEKKFGVKSTFFFLNESGKVSIFKPETWKLYLGRYNIKNPEIAKIVKKLDSEGWEIGLHGSYKSYKDKNLLKKEKEELENILGKSVHCVRQHYGNLKIPETWKLQEELGFEYDSTLGIADYDGFKDNKYLPFYPLDSLFLEIPLTIMDTSLFSNDKSIEEMWEDCKELIEDVEENSGVLTILWHNRVFKENEFPGRREIYERLIELCKEKNAWITNAYEIAKWWNSK